MKKIRRWAAVRPVALSASLLLTSLLLCACVPGADKPADGRSAASASGGSETVETEQMQNGSGSLPGTTDGGAVELPIDPF